MSGSGKYKKFTYTDRCQRVGFTVVVGWSREVSLRWCYLRLDKNQEKVAYSSHMEWFMQRWKDGNDLGSSKETKKGL